MKKQNLFAIAMITLLILSACSPAYQSAPAPAAPAAHAPMAAAPAADAVFEEAEFVPSPSLYSMRLAGETVQAGSGYINIPMLTPDRAGGRRLIYNVTMSLQTTDFLPGLQLLSDSIEEAGGYTVTYEIRGYDIRTPEPRRERSAEFYVRIPTERLPEFIRIVENNYNIWSLRQEMREVTQRYQRIVWSLGDLREQEAMLLEMLEDADDEDLQTLLDTLSGVRWQIREAEESQALIMGSVIYSTLEINLFEARLPQEAGLNLTGLIYLAAAGLAIIAVVLVTRKGGLKPQAGSEKNE